MNILLVFFLEGPSDGVDTSGSNVVRVYILQ